MKQINSLEHHFLVAMPSLDDSWFEKTVIYLAEDNEHGSMGLVINQPHKLVVSDLLEHFDLSVANSNDINNQIVLTGGPIDGERGFILHQDRHEWKSSMHLPDNISMTVSEDFLKALSDNEVDGDFLVCLGFAGWEPGQLAQEIQENCWLTIPFNQSLMFETPIEQRWQVALGTLGVSPEFLSREAGNA
ncbi:YqgE/AlgH family protein [Thiomicrorhabdus sediminis]|uniref:UPF0301 protein FE785_09450 n=1 Tax=Thiomicrorhabdus sediminis TaxID=2580412 RepID=A0A4P9K8U1_9GAMM|nr:YqgE/AlgH family protein [Thiomicrorhabdus sediminis]QCU90836.1 YqgE/AlgH family protein [Thiomicrorhabdus sediminis]